MFLHGRNICQLVEESWGEPGIPYHGKTVSISPFAEDYHGIKLAGIGMQARQSFARSTFRKGFWKNKGAIKNYFGKSPPISFLLSGHVLDSQLLCLATGFGSFPFGSFIQTFCRMLLVPNKSVLS